MIAASASQRSRAIAPVAREDRSPALLHESRRLRRAPGRRHEATPPPRRPATASRRGPHPAPRRACPSAPTPGNSRAHRRSRRANRRPPIHPSPASRSRTAFGTGPGHRRAPAASTRRAILPRRSTTADRRRARSIPTPPPIAIAGRMPTPPSPPANCPAEVPDGGQRRHPRSTRSPRAAPTRVSQRRGKAQPSPRAPGSTAWRGVPRFRQPLHRAHGVRPVRRPQIYRRLLPLCLCRAADSSSDAILSVGRELVEYVLGILQLRQVVFGEPLLGSKRRVYRSAELPVSEFSCAGQQLIHPWS